VDQAQHYDQILEDYEKHYFDPTSMSYRRRYIYPYLFANLNLNGRRVLELACGSGFNTNEVLELFPSAGVEGLDISPLSCDAYARNTGRKALVFDLTATHADMPDPADVAFVVGGLHHCIKNMHATFANLRQLVKPGGYLLAVEPNAEFFLNQLRMSWYRRDKWFQEADEAPLRYETLLDLARPAFDAVSVRYLGGPAYFLILNSLILRLPIAAKRLLAGLTFLCDDVYNLLPGSSPYPMFISQWRRRDRG
jgi:SAM-dependent methyltransferase